MFCTRCGSEVPVGAAFCAKCGTQVGVDISTHSNQQALKEEKTYRRSVWFDIWIGILIAWTVLCMRGCAEGSSSVSGGDMSNPFYAAGAAIGMGVLLFVWFLIVIPLGVFALITKPTGPYSKPHWWVYVVTAVLSILILSPGCATAPSSYSDYGSGGTSEFETQKQGVEVSVGDDVRMSLKGPSTFGYYNSYKESSKYRFLWVPLVVRNATSETQHVNPLYFTVQSPEGLVANVSSETFGMDNYLEATNVPPGGMIAGWLLFEVPKAKQYKLIFDDGLFNQCTVDISL